MVKPITIGNKEIFMQWLDRVIQETEDSEDRQFYIDLYIRLKSEEEN